MPGREPKWASAFRVEWLRWSAAHPEWWTLGLCAGAWIFLLRPTGPAPNELCGASLTAGNAFSGTERLFPWLIMVAAMMLPLVVFPVREVAFASLWRRRSGMIAIFLIGYLGSWLVVGSLALTLLSAVLRSLPLTAGQEAGVVFALAAGWQLSRLKRQASVACHGTQPLAPVDWRALRDVFSFGVYQAGYCILNCGPLMLASLLSPWHLPAMIAATVLLSYERYRPRPDRRALPVAMGLIALVHGLSG